MYEKDSETLNQGTLDKLEEIKLSAFKNCKDEFKAACEEFEIQLKSYPESREKNEALSYILAEKYLYNLHLIDDDIRAMLMELAKKGRNELLLADLIMDEIYSSETALSLTEQVEKIEDQVQRFEKEGFPTAAGLLLIRKTDIINEESGKTVDAEYERMLNLLPESEPIHTTVKCSRNLDTEHKQKDIKKIIQSAGGLELRKSGNQLRILRPNTLYSQLKETFYFLYTSPFTAAVSCDSILYDETMKPGDTYTASDEKEFLTFEKDNVYVDNGYHKFENCELWVSHSQYHTTKTYIKPGIGIVLTDQTVLGKSVKIQLKDFEIKGGEGKIPFFKDNRWKYCADTDPKYVTHRVVCYVAYTDGEKIIIGNEQETLRLAWDENNFDDMSDYLQTEFTRKDPNKKANLYEMLKKLKSVARTDFQKKYTKSIQHGFEKYFYDFQFDDSTPWKNILGYSVIKTNIIKKDEDGNIVYKPFKEGWCQGNNILPLNPNIEEDSFRLSFADLYGIHSDVTGFLWSDKWQPGKEIVRTDKNLYSFTITTHIKCTEAGTVTTEAGAFDNCVILEIQSTGQPPRSWSNHRLCNKEIYFAPGVGLVRAVTIFGSLERDLRATYDLIEYRGTGDGYMPFEDGFYRRYEETDLQADNIAVAEYKYVKDGDNMVVIECIYGGKKK